MNLIKRHKGLALVGGLTLILLIIMFVIFARMIFTSSDSEYGTRLKGLVKIDKNATKEIINETKELEEVENITIRTQGKIVYTTIIFNEGTKLDKAKEIASNTLSKYDEKVIKYYVFGYFLKEEVEASEDEEKKGFSAAGTKHPDIDKISWTK